LVWLEDKTRDFTAYDAIGKVVQIFIVAFNEILSRTGKERTDVIVLKQLAERIIPELEGKQPPSLRFAALEELICILKMAADNDLAEAIASEPNEQAMEHLLEFLSKGQIKNCVTPPSFLLSIFRRNEDYLTEHLARKIANWPEDLAKLGQVRLLLRQPLHHLLSEMKDLEALLPLLWKFIVVSAEVGVYVKAESPMSRVLPCPPPMDSSNGSRDVSRFIGRDTAGGMMKKRSGRSACVRQQMVLNSMLGPPEQQSVNMVSLAMGGRMQRVLMEDRYDEQVVPEASWDEEREQCEVFPKAENSRKSSSEGEEKAGSDSSDELGSESDDSFGLSLD
jgi:hypothetical protein